MRHSIHPATVALSRGVEYQVPDMAGVQACKALNLMSKTRILVSSSQQPTPDRVECSVVVLEKCAMFQSDLFSLAFQLIHHHGDFLHLGFINRWIWFSVLDAPFQPVNLIIYGITLLSQALELFLDAYPAAGPPHIMMRMNTQGKNQDRVLWNSNNCTYTREVLGHCSTDNNSGLGDED